MKEDALFVSVHIASSQKVLWNSFFLVSLGHSLVSYTISGANTQLQTPEEEVSPGPSLRLKWGQSPGNLTAQARRWHSDRLSGFQRFTSEFKKCKQKAPKKKKEEEIRSTTIYFYFLLLFNYSCMPFLPIPLPHPSWTPFPPPPLPSQSTTI